MASLVHNIVDSARNKLSAKIDNTIAGITNNGLGPIDNKALRATLLINRANPKLPKINFLEYEFGGVIRDIKNTFGIGLQTARPTSSTSKNGETIFRRATTPNKNSLVNTSFKLENSKSNLGISTLSLNQGIRKLQRETLIPKNNIIIINDNVSPPISIVIQNRPNEVNINPQTNWVSIMSMGRNSPFMMYTGGEDTISFDISWYSNDPMNREDVLTKCRLLESWSKANGYNQAPPVLRISWGTSGIFDNDLFILYSASYKLNNFQDRYSGSSIDTDKFSRSVTRTINLGLLPSIATQSLVFKKVTGKNLTHNDICSPEKLQKLRPSEVMGVQTTISNNITTFDSIPKTTIPTELKPF